MAPRRILHILQRASPGGATRVALAQAAGGQDTGDEHAIVSLIPPDERARALATVARVSLIDTGQLSDVVMLATAADIVQIHFWNTPELYTCIRALTMPSRVLLYVHVAGDTAPHVLTPALVDWSDCVVAGCPYTAALPVLSASGRHPGALASRMVWATAGFERLEGFRRQPSERFTVGYIGTVDFGKMHPGFIAMHAAPELAGIRVVVCGSGNGFRLLREQALALGVSDRFDFRGYVDNVGSVLRECDVFGYPLHPNTSASAELVLQEAMYCGVPPIVLTHGGARTTVNHGATGLVVNDDTAYVEALTFLRRSPAVLRRLSEAGAAHARRTFHPATSAAQLSSLYGELMDRAPRRRTLASPSDRTGAALFVESLGPLASAFQRSRTAIDPETQLAADAEIASAPPQLLDATAGGLLHYRRLYATDPYLRLWAGLAFEATGRPALAAAEFTAAVTSGCSGWRASWYLARAATKAGSPALARHALERVLSRAPEFQPARTLAASLAYGPLPRSE